MYGSFISAGLGAVGGILGARDKNDLIEKQKQMLAQQQNENQNWYNRRYNEDATQRADAQRVLSLTEESIRQRNKAAAGTAAVMGGTGESVAAAKSANNRALADATGQIAADAVRRKDQIDMQYRQRKDSLDQQLMELEGEKQSALNAAIGGAATGLGSSLG